MKKIGGHKPKLSYGSNLSEAFHRNLTMNFIDSNSPTFTSQNM